MPKDLTLISFLFLFFLILFFIYIHGISSSVYGGDSGDIILASWFGGVAHPPGYPLNTIIGWVFTHLPYSATVAYKAGLMAAVLQAGTIALLFLLIRRLTGNYIFALFGSLTLAFSTLFWLYAHTPEVFQLQLFLIAVSLNFLFYSERKSSSIHVGDEASSQTRQAPFDGANLERRSENHGLQAGVLYFRNLKGKNKVNKKSLYLSIFFLGLAVFHHQTSLLLVPAYLYLIFKTIPKIGQSYKEIAKLGFFFALGFLPYIFVPFAAARQTPVNWDSAYTIPGFIKLISRSDYGTFSATRELVGIPIKMRLAQIVAYLAFVKADFTIVGSALIAIGVIRLFLKNRILFWFLGLSAFFSGPFFVFYSSFSLRSDFLFGIVERFILLSYLFLAIFAAFGLKALADFSEKLHPFFLKYKVKITNKSFFSLIICLAFLLLPLYLFILNKQKADLSNFHLGDQLGHDILASSEPNSIIFLWDDTVAFNTQYVYYTTREFADRKVLIGSFIQRPEWRREFANQHKELIYPDNFFADQKHQDQQLVFDFLGRNFEKFPIYTAFLTVDSKSREWVPSGLLMKLVKKGGKESQVDYVSNLTNNAFLRNSFNFREKSSFYTQFIASQPLALYKSAYIQSGIYFLNKGRSSEAVSYFEKGLRVLPNSKDVYPLLGDAYLLGGNCSKAYENFNLGLTGGALDASLFDKLSKVARECDHNEIQAKKYEDEANTLKKKFEQKFN